MNILRKLLFPPRCPGCDEILYEKERFGCFCGTCQKKIKPVEGTICLKCGKPIENEAEEYCYDCAKKPHLYMQNRSLYLYETPLRESMYRLKYSNRRCYGVIYGKEAARIYGAWIKSCEVEAIVPVPMHWFKERKRGYNQAHVIAESLGHELDIPVYPKLVKRVKNSAPQKLLNDKERKNNLKNAFKTGKFDVKLRKILIIDDIYTTGSTMDEMSRALRSCGVDQIYCLSICIGRGRKYNGSTQL